MAALKTAADGLYRRLYRSLNSNPEQLLMITYCARYAENGGFDLPALIPRSTSTTTPTRARAASATHLDAQTTKIDTLIAEAERFIEFSRERRSALITAAVTGQFDVREGA